MMKSIFTILFLASVLCVNAQTKMEKTNTDGKVFTVVDEMPKFPGGDDAMMKFIQKNTKPCSSPGKVFVTFVVDTEGLIRGAEVLRGVTPECDAEALRVVNSMPAWNAGKQNGKLVQVQYNLPINFARLPSDK
jgi:periplasmic protein TonB